MQTNFLPINSGLQVGGKKYVRYYFYFSYILRCLRTFVAGQVKDHVAPFCKCALPKKVCVLRVLPCYNKLPFVKQKLSLN